ncbi:MAG: phosphoenolpyruvate carboxykinase (ATP) [Candidatus Thermoplasmatota archaeon]|nr:phosphoenolpyruvate carboxykinase (ATP) [Candidatus Thermoplasmatota archaeon]
MEFGGLALKNATVDPDDSFYISFLKDFYVRTADGQYLFATAQSGRRPDRVFYMVPENYLLGKKQNRFDPEIGKKIYSIAFDYLESDIKTIALRGTQGEGKFETGLSYVLSAEIPHSAYLTWMGKEMVFPHRDGLEPRVFNYCIPEGLPEDAKDRIKEFYPQYDEPMVLFDLTEMERDIRKVLVIGSDYFGEAFKKPNLTMVWNRAEALNYMSYHAGCTDKRILKGLSGTGKTTLSVGEDIEQDDAVVGMPVGKEKVELYGLEAASFAKSEGLTEESPEWKGLMKSRERAIVLAMNIDCENVDFVFKEAKGHRVKVPVTREGKKPGHLLCTSYEKSGTKNGRFVFQFSELNKDWGKRKKELKAEGLTFRRFDIMEPLIISPTPEMAVALDSACESVITSAVAGKKEGTRTRSYAATDFMAREESQQALLKLRVYRDLGVGPEGKLVFFVVNTGYVGARDADGKETGRGEKIRIEDSKKLIYLAENRLIKRWLVNPFFGYMIPDPKELEEEHGMKDFGKRFNPLRYYSIEELMKIAERDRKERTDYLKGLFSGESKEEELKDVINVWASKKANKEEAKRFYEGYYE